MIGTIANFRRGRHTQTPNQAIIIFTSLQEKDNSGMIGKKVLWKTKSGKEITGIITKFHGRKGAFLAKFETGLPGQSIGTKIQVV